MSRTPLARPYPRTISSPDCADPLCVVTTALAPAWTGQFASRVAAGTALGLLSAVGLPAMARMLQSGIRERRQLAMGGLLFAGVLWVASVPASFAVHVAVLREDAGGSVRPVGDILLWITLGLSIELTAVEHTSCLVRSGARSGCSGWVNVVVSAT